MVSMAHSEQSGMAPTADPRAVRSTGARLPEDLIFAPLLAVVLLAPLPFGSNRPWAWSLWAVVIGVLILAWGAQTIRLRREPLLPLERIWPVAVLFAIPIVWAVAQTLPIWPASWSHPLWAIAADTLTTGTRPRISLAPNAAWVTIMRLLTYAGIFWLALQACRVRERARSVLTVFAIGGTVYAAYGLAAFFLTPEAILWFAKEAYRDSVTGPFINRNSFATYVGLTILATVALLARQLFHGMDDGMTKRVWRNILFDNLGKHETWIALAALLITATALLLTQSRAGLASTAAGLLVLLAGLQFGGTVPAASRRAFAAVMVAVFVGLSVLSGSGTVSRLSDSRLQADARVATIDAIGRRCTADARVGLQFALHDRRHRRLAAAGPRTGRLSRSVSALSHRGRIEALHEGPQYLPGERRRTGHPGRRKPDGGRRRPRRDQPLRHPTAPARHDLSVPRRRRHGAGRGARAGRLQLTDPSRRDELCTAHGTGLRPVMEQQGTKPLGLARR